MFLGDANVVIALQMLVSDWMCRLILREESRVAHRFLNWVDAK